jgi:hypothetical protein
VRPCTKNSVKTRKARAAAQSVFCAVCERKTQKTGVFLHIPSIPFFAYTVNCHSAGQRSKMQAELPARGRAAANRPSAKCRNTGYFFARIAEKLQKGAKGKKVLAILKLL